MVYRDAIYAIEYIELCMGMCMKQHIQHIKGSTVATVARLKGSTIAMK